MLNSEVVAIFPIVNEEQRAFKLEGDNLKFEIAAYFLWCCVYV